MKNDFKTIDAQSELASLMQMTPTEQMEMHEDYINSEYAKHMAAREIKPIIAQTFNGKLIT